MVNDACLAADVILAVGTRFKEADSSSWYRDYTFNIPDTALIHIDIEPSEISRVFPAEIGAVADAKAALTVLNRVARAQYPDGFDRPDMRRRIEAVPVVVRRCATEPMATSDAFPMMPERILADVREVLPDDAYITTDVGWNKNGVGQQFPIRTPGTVLTPGGFATMGFGPSAAIGAKLAAPDRTVVSLVGDGGFGQNPAMLATAVELDLGIVWVVMNNNAYGTIAGLQLAHFGLTYGTTFPGDGADPELLPNYAAVATAYGATGIRVDVGRRLPSGAGQGDRPRPAGRPRRGDEEQPDADDRALEHPRHLLAGRAALPPRHRLRNRDVARDITAEERALAADLVARARAAMARIADYDQARVDRLAQAIGWALGNETTFTRLAHMSVDESGIGDREGRVAKRFKIHGILRDALRTPSVGIIERDPAKGLVKYAKPAGVIASIVPMTNPELTPPGTAIYAIKARDAVIFSPHPRTKRTTTRGRPHPP